MIDLCRSSDDDALNWFRCCDCGLHPEISKLIGCFRSGVSASIGL